MAAKIAGNVHRTNSLGRVVLFLQGVRKSTLWGRSPKARGLGITALIGYLMIVEGYLLDLQAIDLDPHASNEGLFPW